MNRRTFLAGATGALAAGFLRGATSPIKHIVLVMSENRSFDHLLGWFPNADGKQAGLSYLDSSGMSHSTYNLAPDWTGCGHADPNHDYGAARTEYNNGAMNGFLQSSTGNDIYCIGYYVENDLKVLSALHRNFTTCDRYFPSILGPTFPNRIFSHAGQTDRLDDSFSISTLPTIWDHLNAAGVSHKYYYGNLPFLALWGLKYAAISEPFAVFLSDCANGTLPAVSYVDPSFTLLLNTANDDHPFSDIRNGEAFLSQVYRAVANSPAWDSTVVIFTRDEWGGFFEHIVPPRAQAPNNVDTDLVNGKALLGIRVPTAIVSPWTVGNPANPTVTSEIFDHTSVLKLIESVFGVPPLAARETSTDVGNILDVIDVTRPAMAAPLLPVANPVFPQQLCVGGGITDGSGVPTAVSGLTHVRRPSPFHRMIEAGLLDAWPR
ncbi:MAG TPA: alkaline phosphatase family protein [Bryobacteraceae bacterium]|nr:alkaline phosphatase family protein [Bryobacteraceae bacterium]